MLSSTVLRHINLYHIHGFRIHSIEYTYTNATKYTNISYICICICDSNWEKGPIALKLKNELIIPLCRALHMEYFSTKFIGGTAWFTKYTSSNLTNLSTVISRKLQLKLLIQFLAELTLNSVI